MFEKERDGLIVMASTMVSVSGSDKEIKIDANVSASFSVPPSVEKNLSPSFYVAFCKTIKLRGEMSKLSTYVGSCNVSSKP